MNADDLRDWVPIRVYWSGHQPMIDWCHFGGERFTDPFFDQTVDRCVRRPFGLLFRHQTPIEILDELGQEPPEVAPAGFVFHMSRCGSTLVSQMLAATPEHVVLSEAGPIDTVLRAHRRDDGVAEDQRAMWLRGLLAAYGRRRLGAESKLFVKFDSWSVDELPVIHRAFPDVPWIFLYRDPIEVFSSHVRERGSHMLPGTLEPELAGIDRSVVTELSLDEYGARVLAAICAAAVRHHGVGNGRLVHYRELPQRMWPELCTLFGIDSGPAAVERMQEVARFHAKRPIEVFEADSERKSREAPEHVRRLTRQWLDAPYAELEALRASALSQR